MTAITREASENAADLLCAAGARDAHWHVVGASGDVRSISASQLRDAALAVAAPLASLLVERSEEPESRTVVLALSDPMEFLTAFFGIQLAGGVPAPAPGMLDSHPVHLRRMIGIVGASHSPLVITAESRVALVRRQLPASTARVLHLGELVNEHRSRDAILRPRAWGSAEWPAYIQYTSGSTADPKPVVVRSRHVIAQLSQAATVYGERRESVSVVWVPLHHDMGLVTGVLRPLWAGYTSVLLQPLDFVRRPRLWVEQLTRWSATHTSAPNFGYALCAAKVQDVSGIDLAPLRVARVAGELVRPHTLRAFVERFEPAGFKKMAFSPSYGLAEATLTVTTCRPGDMPRELSVSAMAIRQGLVQPPKGPEDELILMSCGAPLPDTTVRILPESSPSQEPPAAAAPHGTAMVGEVWICGPQVVSGGAEGELDGCPGHRTGDIGFLDGEELVLLGRASERFQFHGSNYYSAELEESIARACPEVRPGRVAVFASSRSAESSEEDVVVLAELRTGADVLGAAQQEARAEEVRMVLRREHGLQVHRVSWLKPHTLPVTTSGKLRRLECRELYERNALETLRGESDNGYFREHSSGLPA